jgi:glutamine synthetase
MFGYSLLRMNQNRDFFNALMDEMLAFGVPIEGLHTETGPGVYEAAIGFSEALEQADRAILFKTGAKEIGSRFGIMPSFMAKPHQPAGLQRPHPPEPVGRQDQPVLRREEPAQDEQAVRKLPGRPGGLHDGVRADDLAHHQQLQAPGRRLLGAGQADLGHGQPHRQLPRDRRQPQGHPAGDPLPRRRRQPLPGHGRVIAAGLYGVEKGLKLTAPPITGTNQGASTSRAHRAR